MSSESERPRPFRYDADYGMHPDATPERAEFRKVLTSEHQKAWIRADHGGLVEMKWKTLPIVDEGEAICIISDHFKTEEHVIEAPFDGFLAGILANPRVLPGHPLVHLVEGDDGDREHVRKTYQNVGYARHGLFHWMGGTGGRMVESVLEGRLSEGTDDEQLAE